jgi:hypothetical protein
MWVHPQQPYDYLDFDKILERKIPEKKSSEKKVLVKKNVYTYEGILLTPNKNNNKKGKCKAKQPVQELVLMVNTIEPPIDPAFPLSHFEKKILEYLPSIVWSKEVPSTRCSATPAQASTSCLR